MTWGMLFIFLGVYIWASFNKRWGLCTVMVAAWTLYLFVEAAVASFHHNYFEMAWDIGLAWWISTDIQVLWARHIKQKESDRG